MNNFLIVVSLTMVVVNGHPTIERVKRQASSSAYASASSSSSSGNLPADNFGVGAAAGIGGLGSSAGLGSFNADTKGNAFQPWGAFAGLNLPGTGKIGAGCSGFSCGFQFGDYIAQFPSFGQNYNNYNNKGFDQQGPVLRFGGFGNNLPSNYYDYYNSPQLPNMNFPNFDFSFPMLSFRPFQQPSTSSYPSPNINDFARLGNGHGSSSSSYQGPGGGSTYTSSSNNGHHSSSSTIIEPNGRVTTIQGGSDGPDTIQTRMLSPGQSNKGIYSASGVNVQPNGQVDSYRVGGQL